MHTYFQKVIYILDLLTYIYIHTYIQYTNIDWENNRQNLFQDEGLQSIRVGLSFNQLLQRRAGLHLPKALQYRQEYRKNRKSGFESFENRLIR